MSAGNTDNTGKNGSNENVLKILDDASTREELVENDTDQEISGNNEMDTGVLDTISQQFESLDYFTNYSSLLLDEIRIRGYKFVIQKVKLMNNF